MKQKRIMKYLSGCLALLGLTVSCNDELYMGGVGVVPATKAYYLYTNMLGFNLPDTVTELSTFGVECRNVPWRGGGGNRGGYVLHRQRGGGCQPVHVLPLFGVQSGVGH